MGIGRVHTNRFGRIAAAAAGCACLALAEYARAHEGLDKQIAAIDRRIREDPTDATLYLRRGELHRLHRDWDAATADFARANMLDPANDIVAFARGRMLLEAGFPDAALVLLDGFVAARPDHGLGLLARARALGGLGRHLDAADAYDAAFVRLEIVKPEHYLERARALAAAGDAYIQTALDGLDRGMERLGPIVSLELEAVELELCRRAYDAGLRRLDRIAERARRKEKWLVRRGEILEAADRRTDAQNAYRGALTAIEALPIRHRRVPATRELEARARAALDGCNADDSSGRPRVSPAQSNQEQER